MLGNNASVVLLLTDLDCKQLFVTAVMIAADCSQLSDMINVLILRGFILHQVTHNTQSGFHCLILSPVLFLLGLLQVLLGFLQLLVWSL